MTEVAAPMDTTTSAAPTNGAAPPDTGATAEAVAEVKAEAAREKRRIIARELADDDEIVYDVDGKEIVEPVKDWRRNQQRGLSADKRFQEAAKSRQEADERLQAAIAQTEALQRDIRDPSRLYAALRALGVPTNEVVRQLAAIEQQEAQLSPAERELRDLKAQRAQEEMRRRAEHETTEAQRLAHYEAQMQQRFSRVIDQAGIGADIDPDVREGLIDRLAAFAERVHEQEGRSPTVGEAIEMVRRHVGALRALAPKPSIDELVDQIPPEAWEAYQRKQAQSRPATIASAPKAPQSQPVVERHTSRDRNGQFLPETHGKRIVTSIQDAYRR